MRIVFATDTYEPEINGVVTSICNFTDFLASQGHQILILAPRYHKKIDLPKKNITIKRYSSFSFATNKNTHIAYPAMIHIMKEIKKFKPDIIHAQTPMSIGVSSVFAARIMGIPCIQTYHTYLPDFMVYVAPKKLLGLDRMAAGVESSRAWKVIFESDAILSIDERIDDLTRRAKKIKAINKLLKRRRGRKKSAITDKFAWDFTRFLYNKSQLIITPSKALVHILKRHRLQPPITDISNGIDISKVSEKSSYKINGRILSVGRLGFEGKNTDAVIKAFAMAKKKRPNLILDIVGDGPARESLQKLVVSLKISDSVNFLGFIPNRIMLRKYKRSDIFVTASTMETQGLVILEALAAALPVIGVDALAIPELVKNNRNGFLVKPGDTRKMAEAIIRLTETPELNEKFGKNSRKIALEHEITNCGIKLEKTYRGVLQNRRSKKLFL